MLLTFGGNWKDKVCRPNQKPRCPYKKRKCVDTSSSTAASTTEIIELSSSVSNSGSSSSSDELNLLDDWIDSPSDYPYSIYSALLNSVDLYVIVIPRYEHDIVVITGV